MPWATPTLRDVRSLVRDSVNAYLPGADASIPNSVLRVMSDVMGALCHLTLQYIDWLALQLLPDTAERGRRRCTPSNRDALDPLSTRPRRHGRGARRAWRRRGPV